VHKNNSKTDSAKLQYVFEICLNSRLMVAEFELPVK
jgi:hypothetical protein